ncbi:hypothetical protein PInf_023857 [Phytophthora infestans]|nr:hypothetical protein PInf_023857 [Phytophthora infestans]
MVAAGELLHVEHMSCLAHCLHLVVGGAMIKKKRASGVADEPDWAAEVAAESSEPVVEHEEEASLTVDDRNQIEGFREVAIDDMEQFLNDTIELVHRNEMDRVREIVQRFRTLAVYFRKSAKGCGQTYPTMPLVLPVLSGIRKHLEKTDLFASLAAEAGDEAYVAQTVLMVNDCRKGMLTLYVKRFEDLEKSELRWVAYLDPRVGKWMSHLSPIDKPNASNELVQAMVQLANETLPPERTDPRHQTPIEEAEQQQRNDMIHHLFGPNISRTAATDLETDEEVAGDRGDKRSVRTCFFDKWKRHNGEEKLAEGYHATSTSVVAASNLDIALDSSASSKKYWATETNKNGDNAKVHLIHFTSNAASSVNIILFTARTRKSPVGGSTSGGDLTEHDVREGVGRVERQAISDVVTVDKSVVSNLVSLLETSANAGMLTA